MTLPKVTIYTDGGANPNPGPGGWGAVIITSDNQEIKLSGGEEDTTNNRMEMTAVLTALNHLSEKHNIDLYVDSQYVKNGINSWLAGWKRKNWRTSSGSAVKNKDLWQKLDTAVQRHSIEWHWVKGHAGDHYNEMVDQLATDARPQNAQEDETQHQTQLGDEALTIFIRVAVPKNNKAGGWAIRVWDGADVQDYSGKVPKVSSASELEIKAAFQIFKTVSKDAELRIYCPSDYLYKGITEWIKGWKKRGWKTASGKPVKHADVWRAIDDAAKNRTIEWVWEDRKNQFAAVEGLDKVAKAQL